MNPTPFFPNARAYPGSDLSFGMRWGEGTRDRTLLIPQVVGRRHYGGEGGGRQEDTGSFPHRERDTSPQTLPGASQASLLATAPRQLLVNVSLVGDGSQGLETA